MDENESTPEERLNYLLSKRVWLQSKDMDLTQTKLVELRTLLKRDVDRLAKLADENNC